MRSNKLLLIFSILLVLSISLVFAAHVITTSSETTSYSVNEDINSFYNMTVNNTDTTASENISQVNMTIPSSFSFLLDSNSTNAGTHTFTNTSTVLSWSNDGIVMNLTWKYFWFNATAATPGTYNITVTTKNTTGAFSTNITITVNDTFPYFNPILANQEVNYSVGFSYDINATDVEIFTVNNTKFTINSTSGALTNNTLLLPRIYTLNISINDSENNINSSLMNVTVILKNTTDVTANTSTSFDLDTSDANLTLLLFGNVTSTISVYTAGVPSVPYTNYVSLKAINMTVDENTDGNLTWAFISIYYNSTEFAASSITTESDLAIYFYNTSSSAWELEPTQGVDTTNNYLTANVTHFSLFSIFGNTSEDAEDSSGSDSGGATSPSFWTNTFIPSTEQFEKGYNKELAKGNRMKVVVDSEVHFVGVVKLTSTTATVNVSSNPQQATLGLSDERKFDVNDNGYYDISVRLIGISEDKANITIRSINIPVTEETAAEETAKETAAAETTSESGDGIIDDKKLAEKGSKALKAWIWVLIIAVIIIIVLGAAYYFKNKNKNKFKFHRFY